MTGQRRTVAPWRAAAIALAAAAVHFVLAWTSSFDKSMTHDEILHLTGGTSYWRFDDYRLQPENGNLPQRLAAAPIAWRDDVRFPDRAQPAWDTSQVMVVGDAMCQELGNDLDGMLRRGRAMIALVSAGLSVLVFFWSRQLFGTMGGALSASLCALSPTVLAHGRLMTSETCHALFLGLTVWAGWRTLDRISPGRVLLSSASAGALLLSKMSAPLVLPMAAVLAVARVASRRPMSVELGPPVELRGRGRRVAAIVALAAVHAAIAWAMVWAAYGFRYEACADRTADTRFNFYGTLDGVAEHAGGAGPWLRFCGEHELLPEAYLYGTGVVLAAQHRRAFLNGRHSTAGWWWFFPFCLLVKTPLPLFGLLLASAAAWWFGRRRRGAGGSLTPIWALLAVYWAAALVTPLNIGHRHLLATYPPMMVLAGGAAAWLGTGPRVARWIVAALALWFAVESARAHPDYLAYFNQVTGREDAYRHLVDSSLDWGQDLPELAAWLEERAAGDQRPVHLAYFGVDRPGRYGIRSEFLPVARWLPRDRSHDATGRLRGGWYCVSATALQAVYLDTPGRWNGGYEQEYRSLQGTLASGQPVGQALRARFDHLRAARLLAFLRQREPSARAGYSILIYDVSDEDAHRAQFGPPPEKFADHTGSR